jgi:hypothetical protein
MLAVTAALSGLLAVAAGAQGARAQDARAQGARAQDAASSIGNATIDQKSVYRPDPKMMLRTRGAASLTPGAEKRGLQTVDPAGPAPGEAIEPPNQDTPAAAAAAVTTDAAQMTPSSAAQTIRPQSR